MANIRAKKNKNGEVISYQIRVHKGRSSDGKQLTPYIMTWKVPKGKTEKQIQKELRQVADEFEAKCKEGLVSNAPKLTFKDFIPQYLGIIRNIISPTTYESYVNCINRLLIPEFGHMKLASIKPIHIQSFIQKLCETTADCKAKNVEEHKLSASTVQRYLTCLKSIFKQAAKLDLIGMNPTDSAKLTMPKIVNPKIEIFTKQEAQKMLSCLVDEELQFQVLIQIAIITGARRGELVGLKFSDIDFENNKITIERSAIKLKGQPITTKPPKDYEVRTIAVNEYCINLIRLLQKEKQSTRQRLGTAWCGDDWLFTQWNGEIMNPQTPTRQFAKFLERHELKHRKFHSLRHTSATLLLYGGLNIKQVQGRLGHGDIETTNKYLHCISEADEEATRIFDDMFQQQPPITKAV